MNGWIGITDNEWLTFLSRQPGIDEVNFWQPGGKTLFKSLRPGEPFLFKLHAPHHFIAGGGFSAQSDGNTAATTQSLSRKGEHKDTLDNEIPIIYKKYTTV